MLVRRGCRKGSGGGENVLCNSGFGVLVLVTGQTPLDLAEDDEEMEEFLKAYLNDLHTDRSRKKPWRFEGAWKSNGGWKAIGKCAEA